MNYEALRAKVGAVAFGRFFFTMKKDRLMRDESGSNLGRCMVPCCCEVVQPFECGCLMNETAVWIVEDERARLRRAAFIRALHADLLELVRQTAEPRTEPTLPRVSMRHPKPRVLRPSKALRTGGKR